MKSFFRLFILAVSFVAFAGPSLQAQDANGVYSKVDEPPVPVKTPPPKYPDALRRDGVSGVVAVVITIDEQGTVIDASIAKASHAEFEKPSIDAVKGWKFKPAKVGGNAVKVRVTIPLRFNVQD